MEDGLRATQASVHETLNKHVGGEVSAFVARKFYNANQAIFRAPSNTSKAAPDVVEEGLMSFHRACDDMCKLDGTITADTIVQIDEMASSLAGSMSTSGAKVLVSLGNKSEVGKTAVIQTCDLDDTKKFATVVGFLATTYIPPMVIFKGKGQLQKKEKVRYACPVIFSDKGNTKSTSYIESLLAHVPSTCLQHR